jgi:hypothetical protein
MRFFWLIGFAALLGFLGPVTLDNSPAERPSDLQTATGDFSARDVITIPQGGS